MNNYQTKIAEAISKGNLIIPPAGSVTLLNVYHDDWCGSFQGKPCDCNPDIVQEIRPTDMLPGKARKRHKSNN